jgi:hypothetical protein
MACLLTPPWEGWSRDLQRLWFLFIHNWKFTCYLLYFLKRSLGAPANLRE